MPDRSPDGSAYMAVNCGAPACDGGAAVFHDIRVDRDAQGERFAFGGTVRAESGSGTLDLSVLQLDEAGEIVANATVPVAAGTTYARARGTFELDDRAATLRFQLTPRTPGTLWADNLYVIPQDGCSAPRYPTC
jgi:hypothetical protein